MKKIEPHRKMTEIVFSWCQSGQHEYCRVAYTHIKCVCADKECQSGKHGTKFGSEVIFSDGGSGGVSMSDSDVKKTLDRVMKNNGVTPKSAGSESAWVYDHSSSLPELPTLEDMYATEKVEKFESRTAKGFYAAEADAKTIEELEKRRLVPGNGGWH